MGPAKVYGSRALPLHGSPFVFYDHFILVVIFSDILFLVVRARRGVRWGDNYFGDMIPGGNSLTTAWAFNPIKTGLF